MSIISTVQGFFMNNNVPQLLGKTPIVGYKGTDVPEEYIVTILSNQSAPGGTGKIVVRAILQEEVTMYTGSKWESFIDTIRNSQFGDIAELGAQALFNISLQNAVTSRRIWRGTEPIALTLNLRFEEEYNSNIEVMQACEALQCMCLPGEDEHALGLLIPPGPSPFMTGIGRLDKSKEFISVYIGGALSFINVIIKSVSVSYQVRMGVDGFFKAAKVSIVFETYEVVTKNRLRTSGPKNGGIYNSLGVQNANRYGPSFQPMTQETQSIVETASKTANKAQNFLGPGI